MSESIEDPKADEPTTTIIPTALEPTVEPTVEATVEATTVEPTTVEPTAVEPTAVEYLITAVGAMLAVIAGIGAAMPAMRLGVNFSHALAALENAREANTR
jgi:hypothetical protein